MEGFVVETVLLYLAVAHFGRGRGKWGTKANSPAFGSPLWKRLWKKAKF